MMRVAGVMQVGIHRNPGQGLVVPCCVGVGKREDIAHHRDVGTAEMLEGQRGVARVRAERNRLSEDVAMDVQIARPAIARRGGIDKGPGPGVERPDAAYPRRLGR